MEKTILAVWEYLLMVIDTVRNEHEFTAKKLARLEEEKHQLELRIQKLELMIKK